jgi:TonB family protein
MIALVLLAALASEPDARAILERATDAAKTSVNYRMESVVTTETRGSGLQQKLEMTVKTAVGTNGRIRVGIQNGVTPMLFVSDGRKSSVYLPQLKQYTESRTSSLQNESFTAGTDVVKHLVSAKFIREEPVEVDGEQIPCFLVHGQYSDAATKTQRDVWVDKNRNFVLRMESKTSVQSAILSAPMETIRNLKVTSLKTSVFIPDEEFAFKPPEGAKPRAAGPIQGPPIPAAGQGVYRIGGGVSAPRLRSKVEPRFSDEARRAQIQGTVVLYVVVGEDGIPRDMKVLRSLEPSLDRNAIEAVQQWRFNPGLKDGKPVAVQATIEVNFRLPDKPPAQSPSLQSVSEPKP